MDKLIKLKSILKNMGSVVVAYSGGADSTFLLKAAFDSLDNKVLAVTAESPTYQKDELFFSKRMAKQIGVRHKVIKTCELKDKQFISNPVTRCYYCKKELFSKLKQIACKKRFNFVVDASNITDKKDFRPGSRAKKELGVRSPLEEAGITKDEVRELSRRLKLSTWDKPSLACLASRMPYGMKISVGILSRIYKAEKILKEMGFRQVRLRHYDNLCRIEVEQDDFIELLSKRKPIVEGLKKIGYNYITLDLEGYRIGSMNPAFPKAKVRDREGRAG